jgi:hypothetical protein
MTGRSYRNYRRREYSDHRTTHFSEQGKPVKVVGVTNLTMSFSSRIKILYTLKYPWRPEGRGSSQAGRKDCELYIKSRSLLWSCIDDIMTEDWFIFTYCFRR